MDTETTTELPGKVALVGASGPALTARIVVPRSLAVRFELARSYGRNPSRAAAAALWHACGPVRKAVRPDADPFALGLAVTDWLLEQGVPLHEIDAAALLAWTHCVRDLPDLEAARTAAGFSAAKPDDSTS
jgi:hypothetical protein